MTDRAPDERPCVDSGTSIPAALPTFDTRQWAASEQTWSAGGTTVTLLAEAGAAELSAEESGAGGAQVTVTGRRPGVVTIRLETRLGDAAGFWHPDAGWERTLPADWSRWRTVSLVNSAPVGCLYDTAGRTMLAFAADRTVAETALRFGVSEEHKKFGVWLRLPLDPDQTLRLRLTPDGGTVAAALRDLGSWFAQLPGGRPMPTPDFARTPVYSTWYAFTQDVSAEEVAEEAALAAELGFGQLFLDDGWQRGGHGRGYSGCGDWQPDPAKFPDLKAHVQAVRGLGLRYVAWVAPLLLGERSDAYRLLAGFAPHRDHTLDCRVLDPRHARVRRHVVATCAGLVEEFGLDGLKIDFLDEAMSYAGATDPEATDPAVSARALSAPPATDPAVSTPAPPGSDDGYLPDIGAAMAAMLGELRDALRRLRGDDFVIELRQRYTGPAMTAFGNALRATDCPADAVANRIRTLDIALLAPGGAVHSDMIMWDHQAAPQVLARQFHGAWHAVPQISTRLALLPAEHRRTLAFWLSTWRELRPALTGGHLEPGRPDELYPQVTGVGGGLEVVTCYTQAVVAVGPGTAADLVVVNATGTDRILLDVTGPPRRAQVEVHDCQGNPVGRRTRELTAGITSIPVPPHGVCRIEQRGP